MCVLSLSVNAAHHCSGKVNTVDVAGPGIVQVNISGIGDGNRLCSLTRKLGEYEPEACKAVFSMLLAAKMGNKKVMLYFRNDSSTACNKGNWQTLWDAKYGLYYVRLLD